VVEFNVPRPPVTVLTEPVSGWSEVLAMVQVIWAPVPSGLEQDAVAVMALSCAKAGVAKATSPTMPRAEARPPVMTPRTRLARRLRRRLSGRREEVQSNKASRRTPQSSVVAHQGWGGAHPGFDRTASGTTCPLPTRSPGWATS
jgi:hypothetical protein